MRPWRNRIVAHAEVDPATIHPHRQNFRLHPEAQREAVAASLDLLGFVDGIVVSHRTRTILNGHLRHALALEKGAATVPVVFVDLSPEDEAMILATFDRLGALAAIDGAKLAELLSDVATESATVQATLDDWRNDYTLTPIHTPLGGGAEDDLHAVHPEIVISVGTFRQTLPLVTYRAWAERLKDETGEDTPAVHAELLRRLGIRGTPL